MIDIQQRTSQKWHIEKYGTPKECYQKYLRMPYEEGGMVPIEWQAEIIEDKYKNLPHRLLSYWHDKWDTLIDILPFNESRKILDIGSIGIADTLLLKKCPFIESITAIDGDKKSINYVKDKLDDRINLIYCDFNQLQFPEVGLFDTILHIDLPEHLTDNVYIEILKYSINHLFSPGVIFMSTPCYPNSRDQVEHISVKNLGFMINAFQSGNLDIQILWINPRIIMIGRK